MAMQPGLVIMYARCKAQIAAHRSSEPGHAVLLEHLGLEPLLDLSLRLGEGTGAAIGLGLLDSACRLRDEMATFAAAGVAGRSGG